MVRRTARDHEQDLNEKFSSFIKDPDARQRWLLQMGFPIWTHYFAARRAAPGIMHWVVKAVV